MKQVTINQGALIGGEAVTKNGYKYIEFLTIPYAEPPVGPLRFKAPKPPLPWDGVKDASELNPTKIAFQPGPTDNDSYGIEDCLYLNVYTPKVIDEMKLLPVMVYIHGGGFNMGTGISKAAGGPDYLIEHDVVVVAINYRLGVFGFLSLDIPEAAGNMGLKDQAMALKWVQNNIEKFGGDKNNVTLFGISAGSASIEFQMLSPLSKGLFHKAILQSGSTLNHWAVNYNVKNVSINLAKEIGYQGSLDDSHSILEFLLSQPMENIGKAYNKIAHFMRFKGTNFGFTPSIEKKFDNSEAFLTEYPYNLLRSGKINKIDVLSGFCEYEGLLVKAMKPHELVELNNNKNFIDFLTFPIGLDEKKIYNEQFEKLYFKDNEYSEEGAIDFFSDFDFISGILTAAQLMSANGSTIYEYMFSYDGDSNFCKKLYNVTNKGACHGDDTGFTLSIDSATETSEADLYVTKVISKMWTNFAKTGNPTPSTSELLPVQWPLFNNETKQYLIIDQKLKVRSDYKPNKMAVFQELYKKYGK